MNSKKTVAWLRRQRAALSKERYEAYDAALRNEEITDQSERLAAPMENRFEYMLGNDGHLYSEYGDMLLQVLGKGLQTAAAAIQANPELAFEFHRRELEMEELLQVEALAAGLLGDATTLIKFSPTPDAVRSGQVVMNGYDQNRQKLMVRIWQRTESGVSSVSMSLDRSHYAAMQAAVRAAGHEIPEGLGSEDMLAKNFLSKRPLDELVVTIREAYDASLGEVLGGTWHAGRKFDTVLNAREFIMKHPGFIEQHMKAISEIQKLGLDTAQTQAALERARYDFAAALDDRLHGKAVNDMGEAGAGARAEGRTFDRDCPDFSGVTTTAGQLDAMGMMRERKSELGQCRACLRDKRIYECKICMDCENAHNNGGDKALDKIMNDARKRRQALASRALTFSSRPERPPAPRHTPKSMRVGNKMYTRVERVVIGGAKHVWVDEHGREVERV